MPKGPIRRAQLIAPFGVGAMVVGQDGTSMIVAGLDHWFKREDDPEAPVDVTEFEFKEWRLQRQLGVDCFRLPPDYRVPRRGQREANAYLTVPFLRFPQWHFCPSCKLLHEVSLWERQHPKCPKCEEKGKRHYMLQVPFVAMCDHGHLQDFPWREWVHRSVRPDCRKPLRLFATGGASLAAQVVVCECGMRRSLAGITEASPDGNSTFVTDMLDAAGTPYLCKGMMPWLADRRGSGCSRPLRGSLRSASNVYFAQVRSSIFLPKQVAGVPEKLVEMLEKPPVSDLIEEFRRAGGRVKGEILRKLYPHIFSEYSASQIERALKVLEDGSREEEDVTSGDDETAFRWAEYRTMRMETDSDALKTSPVPITRYESWMEEYFDGIVLVEKLRETRAFVGFSRIVPTPPYSLRELRDMLWREPPTDRVWLPAYMVFGEGILILFKEERLRQWEADPRVKERIGRLKKKIHRPITSGEVTPRFVLIHTFAHLLMNRLTFDCGYSSAALRERLYVATDAQSMAGVLIYTAAGDAEGTLGGLVRMGKPGLLEPVIKAALSDAEWCASDPVCMEVGSVSGQGPDSCNLAACHNCALVPETACEEFNRFLDRGVIVGSVDGQVAGYFDGLQWRG